MVQGAFLPRLQAFPMVRTEAARVVSCSPLFRRRWIFKSFSDESIASAPLEGLSLEMVVPAGNAPASSGYQPGALLLSYRTEKSARVAHVTPLELLI